jgi:hypothetical protein
VLSLVPPLPAQPVRWQHSVLVRQRYCVVSLEFGRLSAHLGCIWLNSEQAYFAGFRYKLDVISCSELEKNGDRSSPKLQRLRCFDRLSDSVLLSNGAGTVAWAVAWAVAG